MKLQTTEKITCDWWSEHYTKSTKEHQDAICFSQTIHSHNLSGHVGYNRPVSRKKAQQRWDDPQLSVVLGDGDYEKSNPCSQQVKAYRKMLFIQWMSIMTPSSSFPTPAAMDMRRPAGWCWWAAYQTLGLGQILQEEKRSVTLPSNTQTKRHARGQEDPVLKQLCPSSASIQKYFFCFFFHKPHQRRVAHEALLIRWRLLSSPLWLVHEGLIFLDWVLHDRGHFQNLLLSQGASPVSGSRPAGAAVSWVQHRRWCLVQSSQ